MPFADQLLPLLHCPVCRGHLDFKPASSPSFARAAFGVLTCRCASYPLIDGIPIIGRAGAGIFSDTTQKTIAEGPPPTELVRLIAQGRGNEALVQCLAPPVRTPWVRLLGRLQKSSKSKLARWQGRREMAKLLSDRDSSSARDVLRFYFRKKTLGEVGSIWGDYFVYRIGQPRHLAALALASNVTANAKPLLDVACGVGHLEHYFTRRRQHVPVVGVDINFFQLWIAQHWIAPTAHYVCANVADGLPFCSDSFSTVVVSDAYHLLPRRDQLNREVDRVAPNQMIILTRVGNRGVMPAEGSELSLLEYLKELEGRPVQVSSEESLVRDYLARRNPLGRQAEEHARLEHCKWLSFVCNAPAEDSLTTPLQDEPYPHSVGRISLNPIYAQALVGQTTKLQFRFPGTWYAYENHQMLEYHPRRATLDATDRKVLEAGGWNDSLERLLSQFVLIGVPDRF